MKKRELVKELLEAFTRRMVEAVAEELIKMLFK